MNAQHSNFSDLFYAIAEQIASQQNWMLSDAFTDVLDLIDNDEHKQIVIIDHILSVTETMHLFFIWFVLINKNVSLFSICLALSFERLLVLIIWRMHIY